MNKELLEQLKQGQKLTRKAWGNIQYIFMKNERLYISWFDYEGKFTKEANQDCFRYEELFKDDWFIFEE